MNGALFITLATRLSLIGLGFAASVLTARFLGPEGRGIYYTATTLCATIVQFANFGLHSSNTYHVARNPKLAPALLGNTLWATGLGASALAVLVASICQVGSFFPVLSSGSLWLAAALVPPTLFFMLGTNLLVGLERIGWYNGFEVVSRCLVLALMATFGAWGGVTGFLAASLISGFVMAILLTLALRKMVGPFRVDLPLFGQGLGFGIRAYVVALLTFLMLRGNVFLLGRLSSPEEVGLLSVATQLCDVLSILPSSVALLLFPAMVRDSANSYLRMKKSLLSVALIMAAAVLATALIGPSFIGWVFGADFTPATHALYALLPGVFCLSLLTVVSQYIAAQDMPWGLAGCWALALGVMALASAIAIPAWGAAGAAAAISLGHGAMLILALLLSKQLHTATSMPAPVLARE